MNEHSSLSETGEQIRHQHCLRMGFTISLKCPLEVRKAGS